MNSISYKDPSARILILGAFGMVGRAIFRALGRQNVPGKVFTPSSSELNLLDHRAVKYYVRDYRPTHIFMCAAKVGGIWANASEPHSFLHDNLRMQSAVFEACAVYSVPRLIFLGSSCIYPRDCRQPMREDDLLTGPLEETNKSYALAKLAGVHACKALEIEAPGRCLATPILPCNLYGHGDNYNPETSHVIPGMIWRMHKAKVAGADQVALWGTGYPHREFMHADDCAEGCLHICDNWDSSDPINLGTGVSGPLWELAQTIADTVGYDGRIVWNPSIPDGTPRKCVDNSKALALGWRPKVSLREGLAAAYQDFLTRLGYSEDLQES